MSFLRDLAIIVMLIQLAPIVAALAALLVTCVTATPWADNLLAIRVTFEAQLSLLLNGCMEIIAFAIEEIRPLCDAVLSITTDFRFFFGMCTVMGLWAMFWHPREVLIETKQALSPFKEASIELWMETKAAAVYIGRNVTASAVIKNMVAIGLVYSFRGLFEEVAKHAVKIAQK